MSVAQPSGENTYWIMMFYPDTVSMTREHAIELLHLVSQIRTKKEDNIIELILHSRGGDLHTALKMIKIIRSWCKKYKVIIPHYAKSAATLLALGADEIILGPSSELGPLDAQIEHPVTGGINLSALDGVRSLNFFAEFSTKLAYDVAANFKNEFGLGRNDAVKMGLDFSNGFCLPILKQLDPLVVNMCYRYLKLSETYGQQVLAKYMLKDDNNKELRVKSIIDKLVSGYPEHGYVIDYDEAKDLGLNVKWWKEYTNWVGIYNFFMQAFYQEKNITKPEITFIIPEAPKSSEDLQKNDNS